MTGWRSFHLHYHGDRDLLLLELVRPLAASLLARGQIDRFFFVRFLLGGPHIRLRLRPRPDPAGTIGYDVAAAAEAFFASHPSQASLPEEEIRRRNRLVLARAPHEHDDAVYPDNSLREVPFRPETERYGGPDLLDHSLDFFTLSSVSALRFLEAHGGEPRPRQLSEAFRMLARQALGCARTPEELQHLLQAPVESWGEPMAPAADRADQLFDRHRQDLLGLLRAEVESLASPETEAARRLAREIGDAGEDVRRRICTSQLHMTANRLGIEGAEEVYLARLLWRSARELAESAPDLWKRLGDLLAAGAGIEAGRNGRLRDLLDPALSGL